MRIVVRKRQSSLRGPAPLRTKRSVLFGMRGLGVAAVVQDINPPSAILTVTNPPPAATVVANGGPAVATVPAAVVPSATATQPGATYAPIPANGPLPPGNGYQQIEAPGNPYPYVNIGTGALATPTNGTTCIGQVTPRYLPDPVTLQWEWNDPTPAVWKFAGRPDINSIYDNYVRQDGGAFGAVGPGGGFLYDDPSRATIAAYSSCNTPGIVATSFAIPGQGTLLAQPGVAAPASGVSLSSALQFVETNWMWFAGGLAAYLLFRGRGRR